MIFNLFCFNFFVPIGYFSHLNSNMRNELLRSLIKSKINSRDFSKIPGMKLKRTIQLVLDNKIGQDLET